jgi:hypothetical protein
LAEAFIEKVKLYNSLALQEMNENITIGEMKMNKKEENSLERTDSPKKYLEKKQDIEKRVMHREKRVYETVF